MATMLEAALNGDREGDDALRFAHSGLAPRCARALIEPLEPDEATAPANAELVAAAALMLGTEGGGSAAP